MRSIPSAAAICTSIGNSARFTSINVTCSVTVQSAGPMRPSARSRSRTDRKSFRLAFCFSQLDFCITFSCTPGLAPFHEILTSLATGTIRSAHSVAPLLGLLLRRPGQLNEPFVVRLSLTSNSSQRSTISSIPLYISGSPIVVGMISRSPREAHSVTTSRMRLMSMRRRRSPRATRSCCFGLNGECSSHMMQLKLQSSGLVSKVIRHGAARCASGCSSSCSGTVIEATEALVGGCGTDSLAASCEISAL
mmetsp:Transcript_35816/g.93759  ORF Transcript_35816/g.93759 Transcript_35816/m.93759 type:complete len:249 (+) Transcript_35816:506-1252(+)